MLTNQVTQEWGLLACPQCWSRLRQAEDSLICGESNCRLQFAIEEGVPNFLLEDATRLSPESWSHASRVAESCQPAGEVVVEARDQGAYDRKDRYDRLGDTYEDERYGEKHMRAYLELRKTILSELLDQELKRKNRVQLLEVGCGTGVNLAPMIRAGVDAYALDISTTMLRGAAERFAELPQVIPVKGSAFGLPFADDSIDMLYATRFIHQFPREEKGKIYDEFYRVVKPGGLVVVEFYAASISNLFTRRAKEREFRREIKFPAAEEVRQVIQQPFETIPLKINGTNLLTRFVAQDGHDRLVRWLGAMPNLRLLSAYFAVSRAP